MYFIKLQFVFVVVLMALSYFLIDSLNEILQPATVTFYRCLFALIVVGVIILLQRKFYFTNVSWGKLLGFGLLYFLIPWLFIAYALQYLSIVSVVFLEAGVLLSINFFLLMLMKVKRRIQMNLYIFSYIIGFIFLLVGLVKIFSWDVRGVFFVTISILSLVLAKQIYHIYFCAVSIEYILFGSLLWITPIAFIVMMELSPGTSQYVLDGQIIFFLFMIGIVSLMCEILERYIGKTTRMLLCTGGVCLIFVAALYQNIYNQLVVLFVCLLGLILGTVIFYKKIKALGEFMNDEKNDLF